VTEPSAPFVGPSASRGRARLEAQRARRRRIWSVVDAAIAAALLLFLGVAIGRAIEEAPRPGGTQTQVRTLEPGTLPAVTRTVTVTGSDE
jgi:hypothetical protein